MEKRVKEYLERVNNRTAEFFAEQYEACKEFEFFDTIGQTLEEFVAEQLELQAKANEERNRIKAIKESGVCTNFWGFKNAYSVKVETEDTQFRKPSFCWGFSINKSHGEDFTVEYAKKILDLANREFSKGCPKGYNKDFYEKNYSKDNPFTRIEVDMSDYIIHRMDDKIRTIEDYPEIIGEEIVGYYDSKKNLLQICINNNLIYEECNGIENKSF